MTPDRIMGIDPGLSGGLALLTPDGVLGTRMPVVKLNGKGEIDLAALGAIVDTWQPSEVWIEAQQAMSRQGVKQGVASSFLTGRNYGVILGFLQGRGVPMSIVRAAHWKRSLGVPADKTAAIAIATRLHPKASNLWARRSDDGVAEAALIATYGLRQCSQPGM